MDPRERPGPAPLLGDETRLSDDTQNPQGPSEASLVQIYGPRIGQRVVLDKPSFTIGRDPQSDICVEHESVSRGHSQVTLEQDGIVLTDLGSKNGTRVNDKRVERAILASGDRLRLGSVVFKFLAGGDAEALYHEEIYRLTITDGLTGIPNRRYLVDFLDREVARALRYVRPLALAMLDVDHFKRINDEEGHVAGDHVLRRLATTLAAQIRREELLARYGGEEFALVLPEAEQESAQRFAERVRALVETTPFEFEGRRIPVTVSIGVAFVTPQDRDIKQFVDRADQALYRAKEEGRNRVCVA